MKAVLDDLRGELILREGTGRRYAHWVWRRRAFPTDQESPDGRRLLATLGWELVQGMHPPVPADEAFRHAFVRERDASLWEAWDKAEEF